LTKPGLWKVDWTLSVTQISGSQPNPREHLTMSVDSSDYHLWNDVKWEEAMGAAKLATMHRTVPNPQTNYSAPNADNDEVEKWLSVW
jgi:hypothetical protein